MANYIRCKKCGYTEEINKEFFLKVIGGVVTGFGFWAWVTFFFAGTGFALPLVIAIMTGGVLTASFAKEIAEFLSKEFPCPNCNSKNWEAFSSEKKVLNSNISKPLGRRDILKGLSDTVTERSTEQQEKNLVEDYKFKNLSTSNKNQRSVDETDRSTGVSKQIKDRIKALENEGVEVTALTLHGSGNDITRMDLITKDGRKITYNLKDNL